MKLKLILALLLGVLVAACGDEGAPSGSDSPPQARVPEGFLWGVANSAFQTEGGTLDSNWHTYVERGGLSVRDPYLNAVDFRNRYKEDLDRAAALGVNTFRIGINWARVEPQKGEFDAKELAYYDDLIANILARGMKPVVALDHWTYPGWVLTQGAWDNRATIEDWLRYAETIVTRYRGQVPIWLTFNEITGYLQKELFNRPLNPVQLVLMSLHIVETHQRAYALIHELDPGAAVTSSVYYLPQHIALALTDIAGLGTPFDLSAFNELHLNGIKDYLDVFALDYYYLFSEADDLLNFFTDEQWKIAINPEGMYQSLAYYHSRFPDLPLLVAENGMVSDDGLPRAEGYTRADHLRDHVWWMQRAIDDGMPVIGYLYWSLTDNYEWGYYRPRFGLYTVDVVADPTLARRPTDAVAAYREVIRNGGVPADYRPLKLPAGCSLGAPLETCLQRVPTP